MRVVVVGAGCAGLTAAAALSRRGVAVSLFEAGVGVGQRDRYDPHQCVAGVGGAGLFSDGKFSFFPAGSGLLRVASPEELHDCSEELQDLLQSVGLPAAPVGEVPSFSVAAAAAFSPGSAPSRKSYHSEYLSLQQRTALADLLLAEVQERDQHLGTTVTRIDRLPDGRFSLAAGDGRRLRADRVILAPGRFGCEQIAGGGLLGAAELPWYTRSVEYGVRVEGPSGNPAFEQFAALSIDPKLVWRDTGQPQQQFRTFCWIRDGEVVHTHSPWPPDLLTCSGRADCAPTGRSNFGFLRRLGGLSLRRAAELRALLLQCREPFSVPLARALADPSRELPWDASLSAPLLGGLRRLLAHGQFGALLRDPAVVLRGPCLEMTGTYLRLRRHCQVQGHPGLHVIGDASGLFRGIVPSMLSGLLMAHPRLLPR